MPFIEFISSINMSKSVLFFTFITSSISVSFSLSILFNDSIITFLIEDIEKIEPMTHPFDLYLAKLDKDEAVSSIDKKIALRNSDMSNNDAIVVPRVVGEYE